MGKYRNTDTQNTKILTLAEKLVTIAMVTTAASSKQVPAHEQEAPAPLRNIGKKVALGNTEYVKYRIHICIHVCKIQTLGGVLL